MIHTRAQHALHVDERNWLLSIRCRAFLLTSVMPADDWGGSSTVCSWHTTLVLRLIVCCVFTGACSWCLRSPRLRLPIQTKTGRFRTAATHSLVVARL